MTEVLLKCFLIAFITVLIKANSENGTVLNPQVTSAGDYNYKINSTLQINVTNAGNNSNLDAYIPVPCYLWKVDDNGTVITVDKARADVGEDEYLDYEEICPGMLAVGRRLRVDTISSLAN